MGELNNVTIKSNLKEVNSLMKHQIEGALEAIGQACEGHAIELCPTDTGRLKNSITHKVVADEKAVLIGTNVSYAPYVELGTGVYATGGGGRQTPWTYVDDNGEGHTTTGQKAQPYLKPAAENFKSEYRDIFEMYLKK